MTNAQARLLSLPLVMIAGALYSVVREEFALLIGGLIFIVAGAMLVLEWVKSAKHEG